MTADFRVERDSMGELQVPADALWGAQTQRAVNNFPISGLHDAARVHRARSALVKWAAARRQRAARPAAGDDGAGDRGGGARGGRRHAR